MNDTLPRQPQRNRTYWLKHVQQWQLSGQTKAAYCIEHELKAASFYNWSVKLEKANDGEFSQEPVKNALSFLPVQLQNTKPQSDQFVHVERAATGIAIPVDLSPDQIKHWLSVIHQLHV